MADAVISVSGLRKSYGPLEAVRGIDLEVRAGEVFAVLGPNGAGKTSTVEILEGYRSRDAGKVSVLGVDPAQPTRGWRERIGIVLQECELQRALTVEESMRLYAGYYPDARPVAETIELVGLTAQTEQRAGQLSGGQQRRLDVGLALVGDPDLLFLDEPTTGFDPSARRQAWEVIASLRELGKTILLTTHYLDEAQALADRVAIIARGKLVAVGAPGELAGEDAGTVTVTFALGVGAGEPPAGLGAVVKNGRVRISTSEPVRTLHELTGWALERGIQLEGLEVHRPSLEDAYLELTE